MAGPGNNIFAEECEPGDSRMTHHIYANDAPQICQGSTVFKVDYEQEVHDVNQNSPACFRLQGFSRVRTRRIAPHYAFAAETEDDEIRSSEKTQMISGIYLQTIHSFPP